MTVYVDHARIQYRGMVMSHMFADTIEELHAMAKRIGLRRAWFQRGSTLAHYDVAESKRNLAISHGAIAVDKIWLRDRIRSVREKEKILAKGDGSPVLQSGDRPPQGGSPHSAVKAGAHDQGATALQGGASEPLRPVFPLDEGTP